MPSPVFPQLDRPPCSFSHFEPVTEELITSSSSKSCCLDTLPTDIMKKCLDELVPIITKVINISLTTGVIPDDFKKAVIRPLPKKPSLDPEVLSNYRPVTNVSFLSKILEKLSNIELITIFLLMNCIRNSSRRTGLNKARKRH